MIPPTGTVTFLFTDIQSSATLAQQYPAELPALLVRHHVLLHEAIARHNGHVFQIVGDAFCAAFSTAGGPRRDRSLTLLPWVKPLRMVL